MYIVGEENGFVELCVAILEPQDLTLLNSSYTASIDITTLENGTAAGEVERKSLSVYIPILLLVHNLHLVL